MTGPAYYLADAELVIALSEVARRIPHCLSGWEVDLARGLVKFFYQRGLSWKQRQTTRQVLDRVVIRLAAIHQRPDLAMPPRSQPHLAAPPIQPPAWPPMGSSGELPFSPLLIADGLTSGQRLALLALADGTDHWTSSRTGRGKVAGTSAKKLAALGLAERHPGEGDTTKVRITDRGREVAALLLEEHRPAIQ